MSQWSNLSDLFLFNVWIVFFWNSQFPQRYTVNGVPLTMSRRRPIDDDDSYGSYLVSA